MEKICSHCTQAQSCLSSVSNRKKTSWSSKMIRKTFLDYFCEENGHTFVRPCSVIPQKGTGTYFTNAGMNQFKPLFLDSVDENYAYKKVANSQKCIRVGGKHNDLKDVGNDLYHHTFFEMLGNWSFGDYFKRDACELALHLLVDRFRLPLDRLYFTYFSGDEKSGLQADLETRKIWQELNIPSEKILPFPSKDNFWDMGLTGPCGPCTEIHYDHIGHRNAAPLVNTGSPDVIEIWNLVFIQYDRLADQSLKELPRKHVDTGMGLERLVAVLRGSYDNYSTDLFQGLFNTIQKVTGARPYNGCIGEADVNGIDKAYRIIADHSRMCTVAIADGLLPSKDGLGHKLRQVIHHSLHQAHSVLHAPKGMMQLLVDDVAESLAETFPECFTNIQLIKDVLSQTEVKYLEMLQHGYQSFDKLMNKIGSDKLLPEHLLQVAEGWFGRCVPLDILCNIALERGHSIDVETLMDNYIKEQQQISSAESVIVKDKDVIKHDLMTLLKDRVIKRTDDHFKYLYKRNENGYEFISSIPDSNILCLLHDGQLSDSISTGEKGSLVLDKTCFYAEGGGQQPDKGCILGQNGKFCVLDVQSCNGYVLHNGFVEEGSISCQERVKLVLDEEVRKACMANHTATHLLNWGLQKLLGTQITQLGSCVQEDQLTFDFSCFEELSLDHLSELEEIIRLSIKQGIPVYRSEMNITDALKIKGLTRVPHETYPEYVYVVSIGHPVDQLLADPDSAERNLSLELCAGTHVHCTSDIGQFVVVKSSGVAQNTKRVTCVTGPKAQSALTNLEQVKELYASLEAAISAKKELANMEVMVKNLYKMLKDSILPKADREKTKRNLIVLHEKVRRLKNINVSTTLAHSMSEKLKQVGRPDYLVTLLPFDGPRQMRKALRLFELPCPAVVVSKRDRDILAAVVTPQDWEGAVSVIDIGNHLSQTFGGQLKESKPQKQGDPALYIVTVKNSSNIDLLQEKAEKYLRETLRNEKS